MVSICKALSVSVLVMGGFLLVGLVTALLLVAAVYGLKSARWRKLAPLRAFHWPGLIVIALITGAISGFVYEYQSSRSVEVPEGIAERPKIADPAKD